MTFSEVQQSMDQVLNEERSMPTVHYQSPQAFAKASAASASALGQRGWHPRPICEQPGYFFLRSRNYDLLRSLYHELNAEEQSLILSSIRRRIEERDPFIAYGTDLLGAGEVRRTRSELPLVAEFLVRHDQAAGLIQSLSKAPLRPGLSSLLSHIEEMIALDYRLFTDGNYDEPCQGSRCDQSCLRSSQQAAEDH